MPAFIQSLSKPLTLITLFPILILILLLIPSLILQKLYDTGQNFATLLALCFGSTGAFCLNKNATWSSGQASGLRVNLALVKNNSLKNNLFNLILIAVLVVLSQNV